MPGPAEITRAHVIAACEALGLDPTQTQSLQIDGSSITVTLLDPADPQTYRRQETRLVTYIIREDT